MKKKQPTYSGKRRIRKDDLVVVLTGKDRGAQGKILKVLPDKGRAVVEVSRTVKHERYGRYQKKSARFLADDRILKAQPGDTVQIEETRPLSARKRWRVTAIVTKGRQAVSDTADVPGSGKKVMPKSVPDKKLAGKPAKRQS